MTTSPVTDEVHNVLPQEIPSHSLSSRVSSRTSNNYSYSDSFETSSFKQETEDWDYQTTSLKQEDNYSKSDYEDDFVSYLDTFESESSVLSSDKSFKQLNDSGTDTKSESLAFCSGIFNKRTVFDVSEFSLFQDLPEKPDTSLDTSPRFEGKITPAKKITEQKISQQSTKQQEEKEIFIRKCLQRIQDPQKTSEQTSFEYDDCLKQFLDTFMIESKKTLQDPKAFSKRESKSRSEIKREKLLRSPFEAPPILLAKIKMKNLLDTMDKASAVRIHNPRKCNICNTHHKKVEASVARERFIKCKVNDLTRKKIEIKIEDHLIEMKVVWSKLQQQEDTSDMNKEDNNDMNKEDNNDINKEDNNDINKEDNNDINKEDSNDMNKEDNNDINKENNDINKEDNNDINKEDDNDINKEDDNDMNKEDNDSNKEDNNDINKENNDINKEDNNDINKEDDNDINKEDNNDINKEDNNDSNKEDNDMNKEELKSKI